MQSKPTTSTLNLLLHREKRRRVKGQPTLSPSRKRENPVVSVASGYQSKPKRAYPVGSYRRKCSQ
ncbi:hypothetical protein SODALDRAFT_332228 [Sodiomyces alkalinus F11]|uniref:Uncharacterized protein n=1 Tax=Sodiomyces alkalinus (strain CBS 110278 / VKM F-3762 / F11) TaxID=1314773 RepID=A0A3N2PZW8_SODAK|nr:hypothetical protein SODALDRAFT_332228 [Sodiomyces alkalinus F11]ROT40069.1 hypothetical protein SODALDRAFT_332228 [Sodiomyces alkalinus F11]